MLCEEGGEEVFQSLLLHRFQQVRFVGNEQEGLLPEMRKELSGEALKLFLRPRCVQHPDEQVSLRNLVKGALNAHALHLVFGLANAGGVNETHQGVTHDHGFFNGVASGAVNLTDEGTLFL